MIVGPQDLGDAQGKMELRCHRESQNEMGFLPLFHLQTDLILRGNEWKEVIFAILRVAEIKCQSYSLSPIS